MLHKTFRPRLWWVLVLPLFFYLSRQAIVNRSRHFDIVEYDDLKHNDSFEGHLTGYSAMGTDMDTDTYQVLSFIANACLVIGCFSVGKILLWNKPTAPTT